MSLQGGQSGLEDYAWNQPEWGDMLAKFPNVTEFYLRTTSGLEVDEHVNDRRDENVPRILAGLKENFQALRKVSLDAWGWTSSFPENVAQRRSCYQYGESAGEWERILSEVEVPWREPIISYLA